MDLEGCRFLVWGGGGHGKVVADLVRSVGGAVSGYVDTDPGKFGEVVEPGGARVVLREAAFLRGILDGDGLPSDYEAIALAIGDNAVRLKALSHVEAVNVPWLVHPSATVSPSAGIGRGTVIFPGAVINAGALIGSAVIVNSGAIVEHECVLADGSHVSPGAVLAGAARVGPRTWIGAGAVVLPGVKIGADVVVGAGAVVVRSVGDGERVIGVPARPIINQE